ncbi:hypothetical protein GCM10027578_18260 [Spirosoma luteolum]
MSTTGLLAEIQALPPDLRQEVEHFVQFLRLKQRQRQPDGEREFGYANGKVTMAADFDAPLDDFADYQ